MNDFEKMLSAVTSIKDSVEAIRNRIESSVKAPLLSEEKAELLDWREVKDPSGRRLGELKIQALRFFAEHEGFPVNSPERERIRAAAKIGFSALIQKNVEDEQEEEKFLRTKLRMGLDKAKIPEEWLVEKINELEGPYEKIHQFPIDRVKKITKGFKAILEAYQQEKQETNG